MVLFEPLIHTELIADVFSLEDEELLVEFLLQFPLPLKGEVSRTNDHDTFGKSAEFQLANEKARHDRLASASVICEKEPNPRQLQKVIVNGLKLMGEGVDA